MRHGADERLPKDPETGRPQHTLLPVYGEMLQQICLDYGGLPDVRRMTLSEVRFWYDGIRGILRDRTKPKPNT